MEDEVEDALVELARSLVGELAGGRVMELMLADAGADSDHSDAGRRLAGARWKRSNVGGRAVLQTLTHPDSPTVLYDLGEGHFAEGANGKVGPVLHSDQFVPQQLAKLGWAPPAEPAPAQGSDGEGTGGARAGRPSRATPKAATPDVEEALAREMSSGGATSEAGTLDGHGQVWHPDRASVHKDIVQQHLADAAEIPSEGKALLLSGLGHDKPRALAKAGAYDPQRYATVSVPQILRELDKAGLVPEVKGLQTSQTGALAHEEAAHVASLVASALAARRKNLVLDGSGTDPDSDAERMRRLRHGGYSEIRAMHLHTPVERAVSRHQKSVPAHGFRSAAMSFGDDKSRQGFEQTRQKADGWERWDHSGGQVRRVARGGAPPRKGAGSIEDVLARRG